MMFVLISQSLSGVQAGILGESPVQRQSTSILQK